MERQTPPPTSADADAEFAAFEAVIARLNATRALPARNAWEALALAERGRGARVLRKDAPAPDSDGLAFAGHAIAAPGGAGVMAPIGSCMGRAWSSRSAWLLHWQYSVLVEINIAVVFVYFSCIDFNKRQKLTSSNVDSRIHSNAPRH